MIVAVTLSRYIARPLTPCALAIVATLTSVGCLSDSIDPFRPRAPRPVRSPTPVP